VHITCLCLHQASGVWDLKQDNIKLKSSAKSENDLHNEMDKSFIDITPKQGTKYAAATKRVPVKELIARAGNGIIEWGRQLTRKPSAK